MRFTLAKKTIHKSKKFFYPINIMCLTVTLKIEKNWQMGKTTDSVAHVISQHNESLNLLLIRCINDVICTSNMAKKVKFLLLHHIDI